MTSVVVEAHLLSVPLQVDEFSVDYSLPTCEDTMQRDCDAFGLESGHANLDCDSIPCFDRAEKHAVVNWRCSLSADEFCASLDDEDTSSALVTTSINDTSFCGDSATVATVVEFCLLSRQDIPSVVGLFALCSWLLDKSDFLFSCYSTIDCSVQKHFVFQWPTFLGAPFVESGDCMRTSRFLREDILLLALENLFGFPLCLQALLGLVGYFVIWNFDRGIAICCLIFLEIDMGLTSLMVSELHQEISFVSAEQELTARLVQDQSKKVPEVAGGTIGDSNADLSSQGNILHDSILSRVGLRQPSWRPNLMTSTLESLVKFVTSVRSQATCDFSLFGEVIAKVVSIEGSRTVFQEPPRKLFSLPVF
jgi:hypothetical protein